jgi:hypothetical protein
MPPCGREDHDEAYRALQFDVGCLLSNFDSVRASLRPTRLVARVSPSALNAEQDWLLEFSARTLRSGTGQNSAVRSSYKEVSFASGS